MRTCFELVFDETEALSLFLGFFKLDRKGPALPVKAKQNQSKSKAERGRPKADRAKRLKTFFFTLCLNISQPDPLYYPDTCSGFKL